MPISRNCTNDCGTGTLAVVAEDRTLPVDVVGVVVAVGLGVALVRLMPPKLHPLFLSRRGALTRLLVRGLQRSMPSLWTLLSLTTVQSTCFENRPPLLRRRWNQSQVSPLMLPAPRSLQWFYQILGLLRLILLRN